MGNRLAISLFFVVASVVATGVRDANAQAWVGDKGSLDLGLDYNFATSSKVVTDTSATFDNAGVDSHQVTLSAEYTPIKNLAVNVQLPFAAFKFTGDQVMWSHAPHGRYDDGDFHTTLTDLRAGARYQLLDEPVAVSVHLAGSIPMADYETIGNAVAGRHLKMLHVGASAGYIIGDKSYTQLFYEFTLAEKYDANALTKEFGQNRSDLAFTLGTNLLNYKLNVHLDFNMRLTHGGFNFSEFDAAPLMVQEFHDAILAEDIYLVGGGVGYQLSNSLAVNAGARFFVAGQNTLNNTVFALGLAWSPLQ